MKLAKVIGTVVATRKDPSLEGMKLLMIMPLDANLKSAGAPVCAVDTAQAGYGDLVYWVLSRESAFALPVADGFAPVDAVITGIVDQVNYQDQGIANKEQIFSQEAR